jgi:hypothetical protein
MGCLGLGWLAAPGGVSMENHTAAEAADAGVPNCPTGEAEQDEWNTLASRTRLACFVWLAGHCRVFGPHRAAIVRLAGSGHKERR